MDDIDIITDFDMFFYNGLNDLGTEIKSTVYCILMQPERSLYYSRNKNAAGITKFENMPNTAFLQIILPFTIVTALAKMNIDVSADNPNRQIAISQSNVVINQSGQNVDVTIEYIPLYNYKEFNKLNVPLNLK